MKEKYRFTRAGHWGLRENKEKTIIKVENINPWEFRGHFDGQKGINFVFQYNDVKRIKNEIQTS